MIDSAAFEFVGIRASPFVSNFVYGTRIATDTMFQQALDRDYSFSMPRSQRLRRQRIVVNGSGLLPSDTLNQTGDILQPCDQRPTEVLFYLLLRVRASSVDQYQLWRSPVIVSNDSLTYNGIHVNDVSWNSWGDIWEGLGGVDNYFYDAAGQEQVRDLRRASKPGVMWVEFTDSVPSIEVASTDTVKVRIKMGSGYADVKGGNGTRDVVIQNGTVGSRATFVSVSTGEPWLSFRVIRDSSDLKKKRTQLDTILYIDNGILGTDSCITPYGDSTKAMSPLSLRIVCDEKLAPSLFGRFKGKIYFSSSSTEPALVALPVEFIIDDNSTSIEEGQQAQVP